MNEAALVTAIIVGGMISVTKIICACVTHHFNEERKKYASRQY